MTQIFSPIGLYTLTGNMFHFAVSNSVLLRLLMSDFFFSNGGGEEGRLGSGPRRQEDLSKVYTHSSCKEWSWRVSVKLYLGEVWQGLSINLEKQNLVMKSKGQIQSQK